MLLFRLPKKKNRLAMFIRVRIAVILAHFRLPGSSFAALRHRLGLIVFGSRLAKWRVVTCRQIGEGFVLKHGFGFLTFAVGLALSRMQITL